ncbi:mechanosensitive ion channel [Pseudactinotalea sp. HY160]|uniref:mechanosensitive ion channel family protein n=1 Tax=Pseudactinotalea sp. HY160 TaxID=2654490 RepID=UPI00128E409E|nr:mechanosensitive ion channel domain-containing protein [Pseudactinotalea sp. HY160]MPV48793.1 mechanosensitive ion channel [Pseudactinotalea sp. HY160]
MDLGPTLNWIIVLASSVVAALVLLLVVNLVLRRIGRRTVAIDRAWRRIRRPVAGLLLTTALRIGFGGLTDPSTLRDIGMHVLLIAIIVCAVWLVAVFVLVWLAHAQYRVVARMAGDARAARRAQTQMQLIRRIVNAAFVVVGAALVLLTFPGVEQIGTTILASAGLLSVVLGIAAQSSLGNLFAGIQLAFTDAIRIGDIVEVDGTWATVEDITLTYVVVNIWTGQHKVLPSTFFTTTPFINWSRDDESLTGLIYFSLDWRVDLAGFRAEFDRLVDASGLWDGRSRGVRVTDSATDRLTVRATVSSANTDDDWVLRCDVREGLATWLREHNPEALPTQRVLMSGDDAARPA